MVIIGLDEMEIMKFFYQLIRHLALWGFPSGAGTLVYQKERQEFSYMIAAEPKKNQIITARIMVTFWSGRFPPFWPLVCTFAIASTTSIPSTTFPKTGCFVSR